MSCVTSANQFKVQCPALITSCVTTAKCFLLVVICLKITTIVRIAAHAIDESVRRRAQRNI